MALYVLINSTKRLSDWREYYKAAHGTYPRVTARIVNGRLEYRGFIYEGDNSDVSSKET